MPYTQANELSGTLKAALENKIALLKKRNDEGSLEASYYFNSRTPWIRLTSGVNLTDDGLAGEYEVNQGNDLATQYVLGLTKPADGIAGHKVDTSPQADSYGIRPQPGIDSMNIQSHNQFGSLRTATVNFKVWSKRDLDICETLYMRPGMSILLEWGWSLYIDQDGSIQEMDQGLSQTILDSSGGTTIQDFCKIIQQKQASLGHSYDAILGFVKNFSWTVRPDGGYDCVTNIVTAGELVESMNIIKPLSDDDVANYSRIFKDAQIAITAQTRNKARVAAEQDFVGKAFNYILGSTPTQYDAATHKMLIAEGLQSLSAPETQTPLSTFFAYEANFLASQQLGRIQKDITIGSIPLSDLVVQKTFVDYDGTSFSYEPSIGAKLVAKHPESSIEFVRWKDPSYKVDEVTGKEVVTNNEFETIVEEAPQYYVKYELVLNLVNEYMIHNNNSPLSPFNLYSTTSEGEEVPMEFSWYQGLSFSVDPSICLLPSDRANLEGGVASTAEPYIKDILLNVTFIQTLLKSSSLSKVGKDGIAVARLYDFINTINSSINETCGGIAKLDIQYFDHEGYFSIVDRNFFSKKKPEHQSLSPFGNTSILRSVKITSTLTPETSSALAISVQSNVKDGDASTAGFLKFNKGLVDRVLGDRTLGGSIVNSPTEPINKLDSQDVSEIIQTRNITYIKRYWSPTLYEHIKPKYKQLVDEVLGAAAEGRVGQVVIPFTTMLSIDGTSGFHILNGLTVPANILPYNYGEYRANVGMVVTGLEASVTSTEWVTNLKTQYYNLDAGTLPEDIGKKLEVLEEQEDISNNYVLDYSNELYNFTNEDLNNLDNYITRPANGYWTLSSVEDVARENNLTRLVKAHYTSFWGNGSTLESTDILKHAISVDPDDETTIVEVPLAFTTSLNISKDIFIGDKVSAIELYFLNTKSRNRTSYEWLEYPWSAAYVSYMMGSTTLQGKPLQKDGFGKLLKEEDLDLIEGYGSPFWQKSQQHYVYATRGRTVRKEHTADGNRWVLFAFIEMNLLNARETDNRERYMTVRRGDVLITSRTGSYKDSHADIVADVESDGTVWLAGGNVGNTNMYTKVPGIAKKKPNSIVYYNIQSDGTIKGRRADNGDAKEYRLILKRVPKPKDRG